MKFHIIATAMIVGAGIPCGTLSAHSPPTWTSAASFGGTGSDIGQAIKVDREGNRYVTGAFSATAGFPTRAVADEEHPDRSTAGVSARHSLTSQGGTDIFLAKYDQSGRLAWLVQAGGSEDDEGFDIGFDSAGNVYLSGVFTDAATFKGTNGKARMVGGTGQTLFLAKYTPAGDVSWVQTGSVQFDSSNDGYGVAVEPVTGTVYVAGVSQGDTTFSSSNGSTHTVSGAATWHMVLARYDTAGNFRWGESNAAAVNSVAHKVAVDADDNAYVTGWMEGQTIFHSRNGHDVTVDGFSGPIQSGPDYPNDAYIVKYDENGNVKWANHIGGYKAIGTDVAVSRDGRVSVTGFVGNIADSAPQASTVVTSHPGGSNINLGGGQLTSPYNADLFFATWDDAGVLLDARRFGGAQNEGGSGIAYDRHGHLVISGVFQASLQLDRQTLTGRDSTNLFVAKFSRHEETCSAGQGLDWAREADGPGAGGLENNPRIALTSDGDVLVTGAYAPSAQFDTTRLKSAGDSDGFIALLHGDGERW